MKKYILLYIMGTILFSCKDPYEDTIFTAYEELPISNYLDSRPDDFSMWVDLLKYTDLYNTFNLYTEYTGFIPTNEAIQEFLLAEGVGSVTELDSADADYLVKYHTLHGKVLMQSEFKTGAIDWPTVTDDNLSLTFKEGGSSQIYINNYSRISELDIEVINGVIHVIDKVLIPVKETVYDRLDPVKFSILKAAVDLTGYDELLKTVSVEDVDEDGLPIVKRYYYTLFSVDDSTYNAMGINSIDDLVKQLEVGGTDYEDRENDLNKYVAYRILTQLYSSDVLSTFEDGQTSRNINTLANKELINLSISEQNLLRLNYDETTGNSTGLIDFDITCKNGVVHEVNTWLPVTTPPTTVVDWDLANYADLAAICSYFQSPNPRGGSGTYEKIVPEGEVAEYSWQAVPIIKSNVITYVNNRNNDGVRYYTEYYDHLKINTGAGGWVQIESPVIVKGTYKITLHYISYISASSGGSMQCYIDGTKLGPSFFVTNSNEESLANKVLSTSFTFNETDKHQLRIVGLDGRDLRLDYIKFEPLN